MAELMDSPLVVMRAEFAVTGISRSHDFGPDISVFQGPGESEDWNGEGKGVTSCMAFSIGEETTELAADPQTLVAKDFLRLGEREMEFLFVFIRRGDSGLLCAAERVIADGAVRFRPGAILVRIRRPGVGGVSGDSG